MKRFLVGTGIVIVGGASPFLGVHLALACLLAFIGFSIQASTLFQLKRKIDFTEEVIKKYLEIASELRAIKASQK